MTRTIFTSENTMSSITPHLPRPRRVLMRRPRSLPSIRQLCTRTCFTPPLISLPTVTPPCPSSMWQYAISMSSQGVLYSFPMYILPDLMAMQSSPVEKRMPSALTFLQLSGSKPSVLGLFQGAVTLTLMKARSLLKHGCRFQEGELMKCTPCTVTFSQSLRYSSLGRAGLSPVLGLSHQPASPPRPLTVPSPIMFTFFSPNPFIAEAWQAWASPSQPPIMYSPWAFFASALPGRIGKALLSVHRSSSAPRAISRVMLLLRNRGSTLYLPSGISTLPFSGHAPIAACIAGVSSASPSPFAPKSRTFKQQYSLPVRKESVSAPFLTSYSVSGARPYRLMTLVSPLT